MEADIKTMKNRLRRLEILTVAFGILGILLRIWIPSHSVAPSANTNSVNIGEAAQTATSQREFLTVSEVADRENLSPRTVTEYISAGRIEPAPVRNGSRAYAIAPNYSIKPLTADNNR